MASLMMKNISEYYQPKVKAEADVLALLEVSFRGAHGEVRI